MDTKAHDRLLSAVSGALVRIRVPRDALVVIALSGGADSVALLLAMLAMRERFGHRVAAAHFNHRIRAAESDRDEAFVRDLCARRGIDVVVDHAEGLSAHTPNLEERARDARQAFLRSAADRLGAAYLALAHHADDQAETVMMRLLRGAGVAGLGAMAEAVTRGTISIIRPLLDVTRADIEAYLHSVGERFVVDSSNQSVAMLRNRVRHHLIPMLERDYAPGLSGRLAELAREMRALDEFVTSQARVEFDAIFSDAGLNIARFAGFHATIQAEVIRQFIRSAAGSLRGIERVHIEALRRLCLDGPPNGVLDIAVGIRVRREYDLLKICGIGAPAVEFISRIAPEGVTEIPEAGFTFDASIVSPEAVRVPENKFEALFDAREVAAGLIVRSFRIGDRIAPLGMIGHRKLQDVFVDNKLAIPRRANYPIVELDGAIAWLPGIVRGRAALVTEATTSMLRLRAREIVG